MDLGCCLHTEFVNVWRGQSASLVSNLCDFSGHFAPLVLRSSREIVAFAAPGCRTVGAFEGLLDEEDIGEGEVLDVDICVTVSPCASGAVAVGDYALSQVLFPAPIVKPLPRFRKASIKNGI